MAVFKIDELIDFRSGIYTSRQPLANTLYLQSSDFSSDGTYKKLATPTLRLDASSEKHLLKQGDVLFAAKGSNIYAALYSKQFGQAVPSTSFIVLRIKQGYITQLKPEFLA